MLRDPRAKKCKLCIDLGVHIGTFLLLAVHFISKRASLRVGIS